MPCPTKWASMLRLLGFYLILNLKLATLSSVEPFLVRTRQPGWVVWEQVSLLIQFCLLFFTTFNLQPNLISKIKFNIDQGQCYNSYIISFRMLMNVIEVPTDDWTATASLPVWLTPFSHWLCYCKLCKKKVERKSFNVFKF